MAYRSDIDALEARLVALEDDVADKTRDRDEVARMLAEARHVEWLERELSAETRAQRRHRRLGLLVSATLSLALGAGIIYTVERRARPDPFAESYAMMSLFTEEICACTTPACGQAVLDQMNAWANATAPHLDPSPEQTKLFVALADRLGTCASRAMTAPASQ